MINEKIDLMVAVNQYSRDTNKLSKTFVLREFQNKNNTDCETDIYAIVFDNGVEISSDVNDIEIKAKKYVKQRKTATITKNGNKIGWIGEDLTKRLGWGYYILMET